MFFGRLANRVEIDKRDYLDLNREQIVQLYKMLKAPSTPEELRIRIKIEHWFYHKYLFPIYSHDRECQVIYTTPPVLEITEVAE